MRESSQLLKTYAEGGSEVAFRDLVSRYIDLVYSVAVRRVGGDIHLAEDVIQIVFVDLAKKARSLADVTMLGGWLHRHTCFVSSNLRRTERRRQAREQEVVTMNELHSSSDDLWLQIKPELDEAIDKLGVGDREAVVLRFFEKRTLRGIGAALGTSEDAAQKRVSRALEKLRGLLADLGVVLSSVALTSALAANAVAAAPATLTPNVCRQALVGSESASTSVIGRLLKSTAVRASLGIVVILGITVAIARRPNETNTSPISAVELGSHSIESLSVAAATTVPDDAQTMAAQSVRTVPDVSDSMELTVLAQESGDPLPASKSITVAGKGVNLPGRRYIRTVTALP